MTLLKKISTVITDIVILFARDNSTGLISNLASNAETSDGGVSDFLISDQSLIHENCHNSRTRNGIDMKLGQVTKC